MDAIKQFQEEIKDLTLEQCKDVVIQLKADSMAIEMQLNNAKAKAVKGTYSDATWYAKAQNALRLKRMKLLYIERKVKQLKLEYGRKENERFERTFMSIAKKLLTEEIYNNILKETEEQISSNKEIENLVG